MGPFMVEIVFCRVTRRGRKKRAGMNKLARENCRNDGPMQSFIPKDDMLKVTLDLSDNGPVFGALDEMMMRLSMDGDDKEKGKGEGKGAGAKKALKNLLKSGIPGIEGMFGAEPPAPRFGKKGGKKGFHKMNEGSKKKFMTAIFGEDGTQVDTATAAALLAATCSGGDPNIGNRLAELLVPNMGDSVDPAMMGALMSACSLINAGAGTEEVMKAMMEELQASGLSAEEILEKAQILMKAFGKEDLASTAEYKLLSKQRNQALKKAEISPKDFTTLMLVQKAIGACGSSPENVAKVLVIESTLSKKGGNSMHIANAMNNLGQIPDETKEEIKQNILASWADSAKLAKVDVQMPVRSHLALDNENEPGWAEMKNLKDTIGGVSPNSQEAIELNLARATKSAGLTKDAVGRANMALKCASLLGIDPAQLAKVMFLEKAVCENGVPAVEVARVLSDGLMPPEATASLVDEIKDRMTEVIKPNDVDDTTKIYNNLKMKANILTDVIEYVDKTLIQVRCSLEDVADNMISNLKARGEKDMRITYEVTDTLKKTGASASVVSATIMPPLKDMTGKSESELTKIVAKNLKEVDYTKDDVKGAVTEMITKTMETDPAQYAEALAAFESCFKDLGESIPTIRELIAANLPPPPTPPEEIERRRQMAEELERLEKEELRREREAQGIFDEPEEDAAVNGDGDGDIPSQLINKNLDGAMNSHSRRGSATPPAHPRSRQGSITIGGLERRGSYYDDDVTKRATVAVVTDDPEHKNKLKQSLSAVFNEGEDGGDSGLNSVPEEMTLEELQAALKSGATLDKDQIIKSLPVGGPYISSSGIARMRRGDLNEVLRENMDAVDRAIEQHKERTKSQCHVPELSAESRALMEQILNSASSQDEINNRVAALLAGTALSSSRGEVGARKFGDIKMETYDIGDGKANGGATRADDSQIGGVTMRTGIRGGRTSIKRQSEILRDSRKRAEEREEERQRKKSYYRQIAGLRKAKVPLMVYSCGGFSRCFRLARFYDAEGPPVGVVYTRPENDARKELNPEL